MKLLKKSKILIVGLGLIGGSYAAALTKKGYQKKKNLLNLPKQTIISSMEKLK